MGLVSGLLFFPYMAKTTENLPNRIREWRLRRELTLQQVAADIGTTAAQVQKMEVGDRPVTLEWLDRLAAALKVSAGELLHKRQNPLLPDDRERDLLEKLRAGDEQLLRTIEAVADAHRSYAPPPPDLARNDNHDAA